MGYSRLWRLRSFAFAGWLLAGTAIPAVVAAAPTNAPKTFEALYNALCNLAGYFFAFIMIIAVMAFIYAGFLFLTAGGGSEKVTSARKILVYALVGTAIALLSQGLVFIIAGLFGISTNSLFSCAFKVL